MSRVGKYPVEIPQGVQVAIAGRLLTAKGKLGELKLQLTDHVEATVEGNKVVGEAAQRRAAGAHDVGHHARADRQHGEGRVRPATRSRWRSPAPAIAPRCRARTWS